MQIEPDPLEDIPMVAMRAAESDPDAGIYAGETIGYFCGECQQSDETLEQVVHCEDCPLAGEHGRDVYGDDLDVPSFDHDSRGELQPETEFSQLVWTASRPQFEIYNGSVAGWRCDGCGNLDEHIFEICHDEVCEIDPIGPRAIADGGRDR